MRLEGEAWSRYFRDFRSSAFRLELRPFYTMPGEVDELRRFRAGEKPPCDYHYGWLDIMASARAAGRTVRRVRVVRRGPALPDHDFWLFDELTVVKLLYRQDGTQIGRELVADPNLDAYLSWRDAAWQVAVPFRDYWQG